MKEELTKLLNNLNDLGLEDEAYGINVIINSLYGEGSSNLSASYPHEDNTGCEINDSDFLESLEDFFQLSNNEENIEIISDIISSSLDPYFLELLIDKLNERV